MENIVGFYCFSYNNPVRKNYISSQFSTLNIPLKFVDIVEITDNRISEIFKDGITYPQNAKRAFCVMFNHLDMIKAFRDSNFEYGICCEDDIILRKSLKDDLPWFTLAMKSLSLDVLLLGHLFAFELTTTFPFTKGSYSVHDFTDDVWGAHCYMITKSYATYILDNYGIEYARQTLSNSGLTPYTSDWIITKKGKRALVYPPAVVEEGSVATDHSGQISFHYNCSKIHYKPGLFFDRPNK